MSQQRLALRGGSDTSSGSKETFPLYLLIMNFLPFIFLSSITGEESFFACKKLERISDIMMLEGLIFTEPNQNLIRFLIL